MITLHYITQEDITLHDVALYCIALHCRHMHTHNININICMCTYILIYIHIICIICACTVLGSLITGSLDRPAFTLRISAKIHSDVIKRLLHAPIATPPQPRFFLGLSQQKMELKDVKSTFKHHSTPEKWIRAGMTNTFEDLQSQQQRGSPQMRVSKP